MAKAGEVTVELEVLNVQSGERQVHRTKIQNDKTTLDQTGLTEGLSPDQKRAYLYGIAEGQDAASAAQQIDQIQSDAQSIVSTLDTTTKIGQNQAFDLVTLQISAAQKAGSAQLTSAWMENLWSMFMQVDKAI